MEVISIEATTFEEIKQALSSIIRDIRTGRGIRQEERLTEWMDNQDVCRMLNISPRTLQTLRDNGTLAYSQIGHKIFYKPEDVQRIVRLVEDRRKDAAWRGRTI